ncbi:prepilin-type N-terminal cleavage/methylation domain-containing protein [Opitutaceae bacterium TAV1]|nr:prepilin-type N-terminal cleavage/methylation domain-containing protein [Opitutaceae bacterium TAV1]
MSTSSPCPSRHLRRPGRSGQTAFTLVELLTVIAIIGILAAIIIPTVGKVRQTAQRAACASNLRQIGVATFNYAADNKDWLPGYEKRSEGYYGFERTASAKGWTGGGQLVAYLHTYLGGKGDSPVTNRIFVCPGNKIAKDSVETVAASDLPVAAYYIGLKARVTTSTALKKPIAWDGARSIKITQLENPGTAVYLFDQDAEMVNVGMKDLKGTTIPLAASLPKLPATAVHGSTRNVLYFDGHVRTVDKDTDPHEKL